jgi:hypothetical protein
LFVWLSRLVPTTLAALAVVSPETVIRAPASEPTGARDQGLAVAGRRRHSRSDSSFEK